MKLDEINQDIQESVDKSIYREKRIVFGEGNINARIFMIGEAPGGDEEKVGRPFVGKAGKNLDEFISHVQLCREKMYITNVVKIRPTNLSPKTGRVVNRAPKKDEIAFFLPFLRKEIEEVNPEIIVTLGNVPLKAVLEDQSVNIGDVHGQILKTHNRILIPLYHPASIIYNWGLKEIYYQDLDIIKNYLKEH